jgi:hypothetical protein
MHFLDSYSTEFYISDQGYLVIKQECFECGRTTQFLITPEQTKILSNLLPDMIQEQVVRWTGIAE